MSETHSRSTITIKTEAPETGPTILITGLVCWAFAIAIAIGAYLWLGYSVAIDLNSRDFNPLPGFFFVCFSAVGTFFLFRGVLHTLRYRRYGSSALAVNEARLGQTLKGIVRTVRDLSPLAEFKARLRCDLHTSMRSPKGGWTSSTSCLWESFQSVPASARSSAGIPIEIAIPDNGVASGTRKSTSDSTERVTWALEVRAPLRGLDYYAEFPLTVGGHRRGSDESDPPETAEHPAGARGDGPFAGYAAPRSNWSKLFFMPFLVAGAFISAAGVYTTWKEITRTVEGVRVTAHITAVAVSTLDVAIDGSAASPITAHVNLGSNFYDWKHGALVHLTCREVKEDTRTCRLDTGLERWINTAGTLVVGLLLLSLAWALRPPPKAG